MAEADTTLRDELAKLTPADFKSAYEDGFITRRRFDLLCTSSDRLTAAEKRDKFDAAIQVRLWKRRKYRKFEHLSGAEKQEKFKAKHAAIDAKLEEARSRIDWTRRAAAERDLLSWLTTYCVGDNAGNARLLDYIPSGKLTEAVRLMGAAVGDSSTYYHIQVARGYGKTSFAECALAYALATGRRKYAVVVSAKEDAAKQIVEDVFNLFLDAPAFCCDYPDISVPLNVLGGSWRRRISVLGRRLKVQKTAGRFVLPDTPKADGTMSEAAGSILVAHGFDGRVRGMKAGSRRPDMLLLDDLQSDGDAASEEIVAKSLAKIRRSFLNLGGRERMTTIMTSTPIQPDDVSEQIAKDAAWRTTSFPAVLSWPDEWKRENHGLWGEYRKIYERELYAGDGNSEPRKKATEFYLRNQSAMDRGAVVLDCQRYDKRVQVSGLQSVIDTYFDGGEDAFMAEQMMKPRRRQFVFELTPRIILARIEKGTRMGELPQSAVFTVAATDINPSYALSTAIVSFTANRTARVIAYALTPCRLDDRANDTAYHQALYGSLVAHGQALHDLGLRIDAWGIDANGKQIVPVTALGERGKSLCGVRAFPLIGRSWNRWQSKPRTAALPCLNDFVICYDPLKRQRWAFWNADRYKEEMHRAWATETGAPGGLTLFDGGVDHTDFAIQVSNERLVSKRKMLDGRYEFKWQTKEPHDFGDCVAMAYAMAGGLRNITGEFKPGEFYDQGEADDKSIATNRRAERVAPPDDDGLFPDGFAEL